ncbi:APS reductase 3 [Artemisia annua]|uniref:APS reductase 3 n=1 Tax=Artemisia annua TaxID=35608 RepID=A0A2U1L4Y9_ARTAN|nr:APS reductase 3 [Artemisia annua]
MAGAPYGQLNIDESPSWGYRSVDCFEKLEQFAEGIYGNLQFSDGCFPAPASLSVSRKRSKAVRALNAEPKRNDSIVPSVATVSAPAVRAEDTGDQLQKKHSAVLLLTYDMGTERVSS